MKDYVSKYSISDAEKNEFINLLTPNLSVLRMQAEISQDELAKVLGISRQTYSAIERKTRRMSWGTYIALLFFFDNNIKTKKMLRILEIFPEKLIRHFNKEKEISELELGAILGSQSQNIIERLDEQAKQTIYSIVMMEYARCTQLPSETIIKSFGGMNYTTISDKDYEATEIIKNIRKKKRYE